MPATLPPKSPRRLIPLIIASALFMQQLDTSILGTALPAISRSLDIDPLHLNLAITSYLLSLAVFIPISGWMADKYGSNVIFRAAILVFTIGSMFCGLANTLPELVASRILQGIGGAMMVPVGRLVLLKTTPKAELISAMVWLTMPAMMGPVLGPLVGGAIVTYTSWRWIFLVNVPMGILGIVLATIFLVDHREDSVGPLDLRGFLLMGAALVGVVFGFELIGREIVSNATITALLVGGGACLFGYVAHARRTARPIIDLGLFKLPIFTKVTCGGILLRLTAGTTPFLLPLMFQIGFGFSPIAAGMLTLASTIGSFTIRTSATRLIRFFGFRMALIASTLISTATFVIYGLFQPGTPLYLILGVLLVSGFFRGLSMTSVSTLGYADVPPPMISNASTVASVAQQLSRSFGVGAAALILNLTLAWRGTSALGPDDFWPSFVLIGAISASSVLIFLRLPPQAGAELSGHKISARKTGGNMSGHAD